MDERKDTKFIVIERTDEVEVTPKSSSIRHTNPIMKKMLDFQQLNKGKFSVKDLFRP